MRKTLIAILSVLCVGSAVCGVACAKDKGETAPAAPLNGGFETADLSGWTVEYGDAFSDNSVVSQKTFTYSDDPRYTEIPVNHTGSWYLCGKGADVRYANGRGSRTYSESYANGRTGAIRSSEFVLPQDGIISMKLAGGAPVTDRGSGENVKNKAETEMCFVGVYRSSDDKMIARQTNDYFVEHTDYVNLSQYVSGAYHTDNFAEYTLDLSEYAGEKVYLRIVDNDKSWYYGYISVDDIRIGDGTEAQTEGNYFVKSRTYVEQAQAPSEYEIANGGFETGSLAGWTVTEGDAFSHEGVASVKSWWNENITYSRDGNYHYGFYHPSATGVMRSSEFVLGGSGYISWKLGGCQNNSATYLRFMVKGEAKDTEVARFSNFKYYDYQFPYVENGMRLLNMVQYYSDFSRYLGSTMYIEVVDKNSDGNELGCITLDSVQTYWESKPVWYDRESYVAVAETDIMPESKYQVTNGGFETGDLTGWTLSNTSSPIGRVVDEDGYLNKGYNKKGKYLFSGFEHDGINLESNTGTLTSSAFEIGGSGYITYLLGGGKNASLCYLSVVEVDADGNAIDELARFGNRLFNEGTLVWYKADLSEHIGKKVKLVLTDNAVNDWGLVTADSFVTYYEKTSAVPARAYKAVDMLHIPVLGEDDEYQVYNGDFETGDLRGWTLNGNIGGISSETIWWNEGLPFNKDGEYFFNGWAGSEAATGTLESSSFTLGGCGVITFKLGGGKNTSLCYIEIYDKTLGKSVARYGNTLFKDNGIAPGDLNGSNLANMNLFKADLSDYLGDELVIRIVDNAVEDWGLMFVDSFITHYESLTDIDATAVEAVDLTKN